MEDARDCAQLRQAMAESKGQPSITFNELLDELGLTIEDLTSGDKDEYGEFYTLDEVLAERGLTLEDIMREEDE